MIPIHGSREKKPKATFLYNHATRLYIQYKNNAAVHIYTQTLPIPQGEQPTIGDLVAAYKTAVTPLLANTDSGLIIIHLPEGVPRSALTEDCFALRDSYGTTLRNGLNLTRLNGLGFDELQPLIIRSTNDTITMDEYMVWTLPQPVYVRHVSGPNTSGSTWKKPAHVFLWADFKQRVGNRIAANHQQHSQ